MSYGNGGTLMQLQPSAKNFLSRYQKNAKILNVNFSAALSL